MKTLFLLFILHLLCLNLRGQSDKGLKINDLGYYSRQGVDVMVFQDIYPEGHQGGIGIIQNGERVVTNGDLRLEATPGQWQPIPKQNSRIVDKKNNLIKVSLTYPDSSKNRKGFNPIFYPDLYFNYTVATISEGASIVVRVDLDRPLPKSFLGKVGFNLELYPTVLFGKTWYLDHKSGIFPRQANGPTMVDNQSEIQSVPYATGKRLVIAPECEAQRLVIESKGSDLQLLDGRNKHNNGWFVVRSVVPQNRTQNAIEWVITPNALPDWKYSPVVHVSQIGYHPDQEKVAVIEQDGQDSAIRRITIERISEFGKPEILLNENPVYWGKFLRYNYLKFDFSQIKRGGIYQIRYGKYVTNPFRITKDLFQRDVWQPVLDHFLPIQMCHMRVAEKYKVWHGLCHMDDALMAPVDTNFIDGYVQGASSLTRYKPFEHIPGMAVGGWHDAGDDDLRIESQSGETYILSLMYELFGVNYDNTTIDQENHLVEIHQPDGKPDLLQQIEHGAMSVLAGYRNLGRFYRGVMSPSLKQYVLMGDVSNQTDNLIYDKNLSAKEKGIQTSGVRDDRWIFTEENPARDFQTIGHLAAASRVLRNFNPVLSSECLDVSTQTWLNLDNLADKRYLNAKISAAIELLIATSDDRYKDFLLKNGSVILDRIDQLGWQMGRVLQKIDNQEFEKAFRAAIVKYSKTIIQNQAATPFGIPYKPVIWGAGWNIQELGFKMYFLHDAFPEYFKSDGVLNALNFVLGCHPGKNTSSFASGIGAKSMTVAYGYNRSDWSYIPGGVVSGTALIRPDFPELKEFPYLWQQAEYVMGGGSSHYLFLVLAADHLLNP